MTSRLRVVRNDDGIIATHMTVVVAFALFAVTTLTRTTIAAAQIDDRVKDIVTSVDPVDIETAGTAVLDDTDRLTAEILAAAEPLSAQAGQIIDAATAIDGNVEAILGNASAINSTVMQINSTASAINRNASSILGSFQSLSPVVTSINNGVQGINQRADVVISLVRGIKTDTGNILAQATNVNEHANSIDCSAAVRGQACAR